MEKVEGSTKAAVAPGRPPYKVAVFGPPTSKQPAFVRIFKLPEMKEKLANKAFYKADNCTFYWSSTGNHLLALASTDTSQDSYYGENTLYLLNARNGERFGNFLKIRFLNTNFQSNGRIREERSNIFCGMGSYWRLLLCSLWIYAGKGHSL